MSEEKMLNNIIKVILYNNMLQIINDNLEPIEINKQNKKYNNNKKKSQLKQIK